MDRMRSTPTAYWILAGACAVLLWLLGWLAQPIQYGDFFNGPGAQRLYHLLDRLAMLLVATAPVVGLVSLRLGLAMTTVLPLALFGLLDPHQWPVVAVLATVAVGACASWHHPRRSWWALAVALVPPALVIFGGGSLVAPEGSQNEFGHTAAGERVLTLALFVAGFAVLLALARLFRGAVARGEAGRRALERSEQVEEQAAVVAERSRLARDLHDVVAHHVSLIAVRAETAPYTHPDLPDDARGVLDDIAADARLALDELRGVLGILGRAGEDAARTPQPTWQDIPALVERSRTAGNDVRLSGPTGIAAPPSVGYVAYRVVQEALTNARKHAPGAPVEVQVGATAALLTVRVSTPTANQSSERSGHGIAGMRERVNAVGGRLTAGPVGTEFVVEAVLPRSRDLPRDGTEPLVAAPEPA